MKTQPRKITYIQEDPSIIETCVAGVTIAVLVSILIGFALII